MIENFPIRVFRAVTKHLNFSQAAEELLLTQPAITQQIKALEDEYGVPLFDRGGGDIALTAGGKALLPFAGRMKEPSDEAFAAVAQAFGQHAGELALGASQTIGQYLLPTFVGRSEDETSDDQHGARLNRRSAERGGSRPRNHIRLEVGSPKSARSWNAKDRKSAGLKLSRRFSMAYPAGPEPTGTVGIFRTFSLSKAMEMAPKRIARINDS